MNTITGQQMEKIYQNIFKYLNFYMVTNRCVINGWHPKL